LIFWELSKINSHLKKTLLIEKEQERTTHQARPTSLT
jgi:hypothetical protein